MIKERTEDFLKETKYCDFKNSEIVKLNDRLIRGKLADEEKAVALFYWVRDNIPYKFGDWGKRASEVLKQESGMCTNKVVLLISLFRLNNIPSGFGILKVKGQEYFGPIAIPILTKRIAKESVHVYAHVKLGDDWFMVDPSGDRALSEETSYFNHTTELVDWDGRTDAMENLSPETIIDDLGLFSHIDERLEKKPKHGKGFVIKIGNLYLDFLRQNETRIDDPARLEALFLEWFKKKSICFYCLFRCFSRYMDIKDKLIHG